MPDQDAASSRPTRYEQIGRIAVLAAHVEHVVYGVGQDLGVPRDEIRHLSGTAAADRVRQVVAERGTLPPWMSAEPERVRAWASTAKGVITTRNRVLHSIDVNVKTTDGSELRRMAVGVREHVVPTSRVELDRVIRDLDRVFSEGTDIRRGLTLCVRARVYWSFWGGDVTFAYEDGDWPATGERAAVDRHLELAAAWGEQIMRGEPTEALDFDSPQGPRKVPPFFYEPLSSTEPAQ